MTKFKPARLCSFDLNAFWSVDLFLSDFIPNNSCLLNVQTQADEKKMSVRYQFFFYIFAVFIRYS